MGEVTEGTAWAIVAVDRLGSTLDGVTELLTKRRRRRMAEAILHDVIQAVRESRLLDEIVLATRDSGAAALGRREGIPRIEGGGEAAAPARQAAQASLDEGAEAVAFIRGDLAVLEAQDLAFLMGRLAQGPRLVMVPTPGTTALSILMATPSDSLWGDLEAGDLRSWRGEARRQGRAVEVYGIPAGMRPTRPRDILEVYKAARSSRAKRLLKGWGLGPKLRALQGDGA